jgi:hypothetical protein
MNCRFLALKSGARNDNPLYSFVRQPGTLLLTG